MHTDKIKSMLKDVWKQVQFLFSSPTFLACIFSWFLAQFLKTLIKLFAGKVHSLKELVELLIWRTGGMPSSHSALVACLSTCIGITAGVDSEVFVLSFCFCMVTVRDAVGVRRANGIQANMINRIGNLLKDQGLVQEYKNLKEVQGHSPMEVLVGCILGFFVGIGFLVL